MTSKKSDPGLDIHEAEATAFHLDEIRDRVHAILVVARVSTSTDIRKLLFSEEPDGTISCELTEQELRFILFTLEQAREAITLPFLERP